MVIFGYCRENTTVHILPASHRLTLRVDGGDRRACASLDQSPGSILESLAQGAQCHHGLGEVILSRETLCLKQIGILRDHKRSVFAVDFLCDPEAFCLFSSKGLTRSPAGILL